MTKHDLTIIGGGPAGIAAAIEAYKNGIEDIVILERDIELGGILNQCIHDGFGLHHFKRQLTGPEYSELVIAELKKTAAKVLNNTMVLKIKEDNTVCAINPRDGYLEIKSRAVVLAMGCRERTRGAIRIHGSRPAGIFAAGTAQRLINIDGLLPGKRAVILGSGDIGLIMARRMTLAGAKVEAVLEIMPYSNGLSRNIAQCLDDFNIPLMLSTTITKVHGQDRVEGVTIASVDKNLVPIPDTEKFIHCDTVLLSVGLIPENEISRQAQIEIDKTTNGPFVGELRQTSRPGVFACGNVLHVHDLVDFVSQEGVLAGSGAAKYINGSLLTGFTHLVVPGEGVSYVVPQKINIENVQDKITLMMRVKRVYENSSISAYLGENKIAIKREPKFLPAEIIDLEISKADLIKYPEQEILIKIG